MSNKKKLETFRPQFDVDEVYSLVGYGKKSNFYNEAILKEIEYYKSTSKKKYIDLKRDVRSKTKAIELRNKEIEDIEDLIEDYNKRLKKLKREQEREQNKLIKMNKDLERLRTTRKTINKDNKEYKKLLEENKESIIDFANEVLHKFFLHDILGIPLFIKDRFFYELEEYKGVRETFGTFENFINKYFYDYVKKEVLNDNFYTYKSNKLEFWITSEQMEELKKVVENKSILNTIYDVKE